MTQLARYDQARFALAECQRVDEVKDIRDKAEAMAAYARQAKDTELVQWATEIKVRAERKAGELLSQAAESGDRAPQGRVSPAEPKPTTLGDLGISSNQSSRWQSLASMTACRSCSRWWCLVRTTLRQSAQNLLRRMKGRQCWSWFLNVPRVNSYLRNFRRCHPTPPRAGFLLPTVKKDCCIVLNAPSR